MRSHLPVAAVLSFVLAAACTAADPPAEGRPGESAQLAFAQCMRERGYDWPDPVWTGQGWDTRVAEDLDPDDPAFEADIAGCEQVRDGLAPPAAADPDALEAELQQRLEFAACMRAEGIDFPDPRLEDGGIGELAGPIDGDWEAFEAASAVCEAQVA